MYQDIERILKGTIYENGVINGVSETPLSYGVRLTYPDRRYTPAPRLLVVQKQYHHILDLNLNCTLASVVEKGYNTLTDYVAGVYGGLNSNRACEPLHKLELRGDLFSIDTRTTTDVKIKDACITSDVLGIRYSVREFDGTKVWGIWLMDVFGVKRSVKWDGDQFTNRNNAILGFDKFRHIGLDAIDF